MSPGFDHIQKKPGPPILRRQPKCICVVSLCFGEHFGLLLWNPFVCFSEIVSSFNAEQPGRPDAQQITGFVRAPFHGMT